MILLTYGTRPEYIKIKPLINQMIKENIPFKTICTGQHEDIVTNNADYVLKMKNLSNNRLDSIVKNCLQIPDEWFIDIQYILVQGDTTSVVGLALAALHRQIKVIHLEAGLRTYDILNPYPEENNRRIVSTLAYLHLCPTENNKNNLLREGITNNIYVVGNTGLDNLSILPYELEYNNKILVTLHRRENHEQMDLWFTEINDLAITYPEFEFILPIHPNPMVKKHKHLLTNITVIEPLQHKDLIKLLFEVKMVITDSGGIQEECSYLHKKCLVCRKVTERPESVGISSFLINSPNNLKEIFNHHIKNFYISNELLCPYGDGNSSKKICDIFKATLTYLDK